MSKLIRNNEDHHSQEVVAPLALSLSNSDVITHLKACQGIASRFAARGFKSFISDLNSAIDQEIFNAKSDSTAREWSETQSLIRDNAQRLERYFCGYLAEGFVKFKKRELKTVVGQEEASGELSLVGNEELEESISMSSIAQRADTYYAEPIWALNQRMAVLNRGEHVTEQSNPAAPVQFCDSLRKALKVLPLKLNAKLLAYREFDDKLLQLLREVLQDTNTYLKEKGILPHLKYSLPSQSAPSSSLSNADSDAVNHGEIKGLSDQNLSPEEYQKNLMQAIQSLQLQQKNEGASTVPLAGVPVSSTDLVKALQVMQQQPVQLPALAAAGEGVAPVDVSSVLKNLKKQLESDTEDGVIDQEKMRTIDLVGMLFQYMLNDDNLPDSVKALLSHLHTPFLKVAFSDPAFFEQTEHPARLLLNSLADAGSRWVGNDGTSQHDVYEKIKGVVDKILKEYDNDIKMFTQLLLDFNSHTKNILRRQQLMEKRATEKAQGEEKLRLVKIKVNREIRRRTENKELPSAVLVFLLQPWSDYLSFALLRYGDQSDKWESALQVVDDVLWGVEPKESDQDKKRQYDGHGKLMASIRSGFDTIGFDQTKGDKLLDALEALLKLAMQSKNIDPAPAPMRDQLERIAAEKAGTPEVDTDSCTAEEARMVESLKMIEFGTWFEFEGGRRLKVAWYNSRTSHYMLVDQIGKRVDMMSGLKMAREMIAGTAKIISGSSKPFFERALENIFHKLNHQADGVDVSSAC